MYTWRQMIGRDAILLDSKESVGSSNDVRFNYAPQEVGALVIVEFGVARNISPINHLQKHKRRQVKTRF